MKTTIDLSLAQEIYSVSQLNREVRCLLESRFPCVWVEGEISNFACPNSGHWYFSLKDATAQIRCAMFKQHNRRLTIPTEGSHVLIKARISLYEGRGDFQLLVEHMEEAGVGKLRQEFEALKKRLFAAGLFAEEHKKKLPFLPECIGIITSQTGAAIRDILSVLKRRFPYANIIIYPTLVQGELAPKQIIKAIQTANLREECDVIILARGGGSIEDLWCFNDEKVAYAIYESKLPIVSAVGHEIDFTIADFVADLRAPTPSVAAELIAPDQSEIQIKLTNQRKLLLRLLTNQHQALSERLHWLTKQLYREHPKRKLQEQTQQLDSYEIAIKRLIEKKLQQQTMQFSLLKTKLTGSKPNYQLTQQTLNTLSERLSKTMQHTLELNQHSIANLGIQLDALSPLNTLKRGFAIVTDESKKIITSSKKVQIGSSLHLKLKEGELRCKVIHS